ncbi:peptidase S41 [Gloeothece citriformis PCC 7424]|uniref:Peptidase S41 n=1 Tax=Gloeothece citriformis (strain PCC 7424) TaxID=65393 RepID=B7KD43_GLOC7|nr:S41 family peptidase [Gloeothece citriformis]ACK73164.1 peptidase S41 [Gloeothece citriformis PCC 7424]
MKKYTIKQIQQSLGLVSLVSIVAILVFSIHLILPVFSQDKSSNIQVFNQVWQTVQENFYDSNFNGVDWESMKQKYSDQVKSSQTKAELADVINQMLSELNTSHTHFYTPQQTQYYQLLGIFASGSPQLQEQLKQWFPTGEIEYSGIGIFTKEIDGQIFVSGVLDGLPAHQAGILVGDRIISVEGKPFDPVESFRNKAGQPVTLTIQRQSLPNPETSVTVVPKMLNANTMFSEAMKASIEVKQIQNKNIGYVHIWSYAGEQYQELLEDELFYGELRSADVLVLDLRGGWGGAPLTALNIYTAKPLSIKNVPRNRAGYTINATWNKPVIMIVDGGSRSSKEILAFAFKQQNIGLVVGSKTPGAVVAGRAFLMDDGSLLYVAVGDVYVYEKYRLEGQGVMPDIEVPFPLQYAQGKDAQKERAIEEALKAVE